MTDMAGEKRFKPAEQSPGRGFAARATKMATKFTDLPGSDESCSVTADRSSGLSAGSPLQEGKRIRTDNQRIGLNDAAFSRDERGINPDLAKRGEEATNPAQGASGPSRDPIAVCRDEIEFCADATEVRKDSSSVRIDETWMRKGEIEVRADSIKSVQTRQ